MENITDTNERQGLISWALNQMEEFSQGKEPGADPLCTRERRKIHTHFLAGGRFSSLN